MTPSILQAGFYDWVSTGRGSCVLTAVAGAGKTTTLIESLNLMFGTIFFGAYSKKIADELQARAPQKEGLTISTMHAAGMRAWKPAADKFMKVDANKCRDIFRDMTFRSMEEGILEGPVLQLLSYAKQAAFGVLKDEEARQNWIDLIDHFDVECFNERSGQDNTDAIIRLAQELFKRSAQLNTKIIDFDDMIFAPLYHNVRFKKYDWVLLDEAQDTNASRRELSLRMLKEGGRLVAVGDPHQAIYGFTGADSNSLDLIGDAVNAIKLPLTVTYRCPKAVVKYAQQWVSHIQAHESAPEGTVRQADIENLQKEVKVGDAILCRFNAPLIQQVYSLIAAGIPARVEGREIGTGLKNLANRWKVKTIQALLEKLEAFLEREVKKFTAKEQLNRIQDVTDKVECLRVIINRVIAKGTLTQPPQVAVMAEIDTIFGDSDDKKNQKPCVILASGHRGKGLEWNRVFWLQTGPNKLARLPWQIVQENNLQYVIATRAKSELILINIAPKRKEA